MEHRRRRSRSAKRPIVPDIDPATPRVSLALGQDWHNRIIAMKALGRHDMGLHKAADGIKRLAD